MTIVLMMTVSKILKQINIIIQEGAIIVKTIMVKIVHVIMQLVRVVPNGVGFVGPLIMKIIGIILEIVKICILKEIIIKILTLL